VEQWSSEEKSSYETPRKILFRAGGAGALQAIFLFGGLF
jgi:hypothetical protein